MKHGLPVRALETSPLWGFRQVESVSTSFQFSFCLIPNILVHFRFSLVVLIKCFDKTTQGSKHSDSQFRDVVHHGGEIKVTRVWSNYSVTFTAGKWWCPVLIFHSVQHPSQRMAPPTLGSPSTFINTIRMIPYGHSQEAQIPSDSVFHQPEL